MGKVIVQTVKANAKELVETALEIADDYAASIIECNGVNVRSKSGALLWYEVDPSDEYCGWEIERAIRYLDMRGKLRHRNGYPNHVKVA